MRGRWRRCTSAGEGTPWAWPRFRSTVQRWEASVRGKRSRAPDLLSVSSCAVLPQQRFDPCVLQGGCEHRLIDDRGGTCFYAVDKCRSPRRVAWVGDETWSSTRSPSGVLCCECACVWQACCCEEALEGGRPECRRRGGEGDAARRGCCGSGMGWGRRVQVGAVKNVQSCLWSANDAPCDSSVRFGLVFAALELDVSPIGLCPRVADARSASTYEIPSDFFARFLETSLRFSTNHH